MGDRMIDISKFKCYAYFRKLALIVEIILENEGIVLTNNYLIKNSYIGKRENIYKASHTEQDIKDKLKDKEFYFGLSKFHREILERNAKIFALENL